MNLHDLVKYGRKHLDGELGMDHFLNSDTWQRLHKPIMNDYAYGWVNTLRDWAGGPVIWHNGSNTMWYALPHAVTRKECCSCLRDKQWGDSESRESIHSSG